MFDNLIFIGDYGYVAQNIKENDEFDTLYLSYDCISGSLYETADNKGLIYFQYDYSLEEDNLEEEFIASPKSVLSVLREDFYERILELAKGFDSYTIKISCVSGTTADVIFYCGHKVIDSEFISNDYGHYRFEVR